MKKILIGDDQIEVREWVAVTLRYGNFKILQASNGLDAIAIVKKEKPLNLINKIEEVLEG